MNILYKILNEALLQWDNSNIEDSGLIKASDVVNKMKPQLVYKIDEQKRIKIFDEEESEILNKFKDKVYINGVHVQLDKNGYTVNEYEPGEYGVYIKDFNKIKKINDGTFWRCSDLTSIIVPDKVTSIGGSAFGCCSSLTSVTIPDKVTSIGDYAFIDCTGLTEVIIPNSVTTIGYDVFYNCQNLKTIYVESISKFKKIKFLGHGDKTELLRNVKLIKKQGLNEALLQWDNSDTEDDSRILNHHNIKRSFERIDLNDYKKSVAYWRTENYNYPWFKNYINDIINLYFNNKQDFEKYIKTCINDSNSFDRDKDQAIYYSVTNNYSLFIDKLFRMPDESELKDIVDITKYVPLKWQSTFWNIAIFGDKGLIWCIVKYNEK